MGLDDPMSDIEMSCTTSHNEGEAPKLSSVGYKYGIFRDSRDFGKEAEGGSTIADDFIMVEDEEEDVEMNVGQVDTVCSAYPGASLDINPVDVFRCAITEGLARMLVSFTLNLRCRVPPNRATSIWLSLDWR
jgi:hypothetical protein